jgi:hypothetical protein
VVDREVKSIVSLSFGRIFTASGDYHKLNSFDDYLNDEDSSEFSILEIWRDEELVAKRGNTKEEEIEELIKTTKQEIDKKLNLLTDLREELERLAY